MLTSGANRAWALLLAVMLALFLGAAAAHASRGLEAPEETRFSGSTRELTFSASVGSIICEVTAIGTVHRTITKIRGALVGQVTDVRIGAPATCRAGGGVRSVLGIRVLGLPWHIQYQSFVGTLPNITGFTGTIARAQFLLELLDIFGQNYRCLYMTDQPGTARLERSEITRLELTAVRIAGAALAGSVACPSGELRGAYTLATPVRIRLI